MKSIFSLILIGFFIAACAPSSNNTSNPVQGSPVDEASYNAILDVKWCQPIVNREQDFVISWIFLNDATARWVKSNIETQQVLQSQQVNWGLQNKTLIVKDLISDLVILQKEISVEYDLNQARKIMKWVTPSTTQCSGAPGSCSTTSADVMTLSECP